MTLRQLKSKQITSNIDNMNGSLNRRRASSWVGPKGIFFSEAVNKELSNLHLAVN
jgi:hypothetical protein